MDWKWNHIRIEGNNNLVLQDVDGNTTTIAITAFIEIFTKEKDARIDELRGWLIAQEKLERFADAERTRMQAELQKLQEENAILEERIPILLQEFNNKDISRTDALYQEAFALFMNGNVDEALDVLDDTKLNAKKQELKHEQQKLAETFLLKADLLQLKFDFKAAVKNFEEALSIAPVWANYLKAANFHQFLNDFLPAETLYKQALALAETSDEKATTLNNLAALQSDKNEFEAAELGYREALQIRRELAATNPQAFLPDVAMTLINLGIFYLQSVPERDKSVACIAEALQILKPLTARIPYLQQYEATALQVASAWEIDPDELLKSL